MKELPKTYEAGKYEDKIYKSWEDSGYFHPEKMMEDGLVSDDAEHFSMVLPPPNVTGTLHMGHAAMLAIEDLIVRYHRMKGQKTLWIPGTDHAAIATQTKVEKLLMEKEGMKDPRAELGREDFLERVREFAQQSHDTIVNQCKKMGASLDWRMEAYTLDEARSLAVRTVFKKMYDGGLIYRGYRLVNWCPRCHSTLADDEVDYKEQSAKLYTFRYSPDFPFAIASTRPETKLGDTAVAVNPNDDRYKKYIGHEFDIKNFAGGADLKIKIISDETVAMDFGTGALGVTPAHSQVDYEMAQKNNLPIVKVIDENGKMTAAAGLAYEGLSVSEARKKVIENLRVAGLLEKEEDVTNNLSTCYRCGMPIEPLPSKQWFVAVNKEFTFCQSADNPINGLKDGQTVTLKQLMQKAVENGQIEIIPDKFNKIYFHWIDNLRDWCISRQIWFGHQIPVWYKGEEIFVGVEAPAEDGWTQDPDTLDTWFSSGLWTFSTLGWPNKTMNLKSYHPTNVLETGYDILFFWVARMILMTTYTLGEIPFHKVYLHGLVRDENGRKMSKSLGNVIDPLEMIKKYGADATRLSLLLGNTSGNDMKLSREKVEGFRNFTNKLWNISRFMLLNIEKPNRDMLEPEAVTAADAWILNKLGTVIKDVSENIDKYNFSYAGEQLRDFTWGDLADWYLEVAKIEGNKSEILNYLLNTILKLWHPFMPFATEAVWQEVYGGKMIMTEIWPAYLKLEKPEDRQNVNFELIKNIIVGIRSLRASHKIEPAKKIDCRMGAGRYEQMLRDNEKIIVSLARLNHLELDKQISKPDNSVGFVEGGVEIYLDISGAIDIVAERARLEKEIDRLEKYTAGTKIKLANADFIQKAPAEVVEAERNKLAEAEEKKQKIAAQLLNLK